jgi:hypothetical protein
LSSYDDLERNNLNGLSFLPGWERGLLPSWTLESAERSHGFNLDRLGDLILKSPCNAAVDVGCTMDFKAIMKEDVLRPGLVFGSLRAGAVTSLWLVPTDFSPAKFSGEYVFVL